MRLVNPNDAANPFYVGKCKNNTAPKHVEAQGLKKTVKIDKSKAVMYNSPKTAEYIYLKVGDDWLFIKDKSVFELGALTTAPVTRSKEGEAEASVGSEATA